MTKEARTSDSVILQVGLHPDKDESKIQMRLPKDMFARIQMTVGDIFREHRGVIFVAATFAVAASASAYVVYKAAEKRRKNWEIKDPFAGSTLEEQQLFETVFQSHFLMLVKFLATTISINRQEAKDIAQETFLRVAPVLPKIIPTDHPKYPYGPYLCTVAKRIAFNSERDFASRSKKEIYLEVRDEREGLPTDTPFRDELDPEAIVLEKEEEKELAGREAIARNQLFEVMNELTNEQKALVWLKFLLERPDKEIASIYQVGLNVIKSRIHRLRGKLKKLGLEISNSSD